MYVVKRSFRDVGGMVPAGSVVEPAGIRNFKRRVLEGHIVEVNEQNFDRYVDFFKQRYDVDLPPIKQAVSAEAPAELPASKQAAKAVGVKKVVTAK